MSSRASAPDTPADIELRSLLDGDHLKCFVMVAGAGSGKTTSLVKALNHVVTRHGTRLRSRTQNVACITYTEVAAKEIHSDVGNSPLVAVSTIHSFLWSLVKPFQRDIAKWVQRRVDKKVQELIEKQESYSSRTRKTTIEKDSSDLEKLHTQRKLLNEVEHYSYGTGSDYVKGVLGHEDIVTMVPELILGSSLFARVVANKFPYIFVDESQDTFPNVVEALKHVSTQAQGAVCLGFFGDPMQQIYQRGMGAISREPGWDQIEKPENFRSSNKVLEVINRVRSEADGLVQVPGRPVDKRVEGEFFFFVLPSDDRRSEHLERVRLWLEQHSNAGSWAADSTDYDENAKILMIVHRMVARRMSFEQLYAAFHDSGSKSLKATFDEGNAWPLRPFEDVILPICAADTIDSPSVIAVLREHSAVLDMETPGPDIRTRMMLAREAVGRLRKSVETAGLGSVGTVLRTAVKTGLVAADPRLSAYLEPEGEHADIVLSPETVEVLDAFTACDIGELPAYFKYIGQHSPYSTQHGTKGAEFPKVIVVLDDEEGDWGLYSYEKLFGIKDLSDADKKNLATGKDSVLERTRRLLYVCVSRAVDSLAVVLFAGDIVTAKLAIERSGITAAGKVLTEADLALL
ncbi:UvrD-helicase domain-containing protein [Streptomyces scabiei]|uniref:UvrD-helicase domain-containing protein n=2 Tax=Streptomyces scabiei TaxID=1930 RepID=UPI001B331D9F|nr:MULTISPECIES: UvrD-helicase domain-containing protein [Streptomyces]MBP5892154.1 ATP-dependent helicase [Streptomyces sp. LBUM 1481]MBP5922389.1 ATP-dependent helicase [Streptomyces sp. LBUM 1483]MDX2748988.1 UvrD-helicase domain-containing protein [Streptomyces scabiei]MDX3196709.1 UvrD-helicase domain-containing protein [Streptomyces scabiei]